MSRFNACSARTSGDRQTQTHTHTHTHTQTHRPSTVTLAAHARRGLIIVIAAASSSSRQARRRTANSAVIQQTLDLTEGCVYRDFDSEFNSWQSEGSILKGLCSLVAV